MIETLYLRFLNWLRVQVVFRLDCFLGRLMIGREALRADRTQSLTAIPKLTFRMVQITAACGENWASRDLYLRIRQIERKGREQHPADD